MSVIEDHEKSIGKFVNQFDLLVGGDENHCWSESSLRNARIGRFKHAYKLQKHFSL